MSDSAPARAGFDRAAAAILGSMITLIAALSFVLVEMSVDSGPGEAPVATFTAEGPAPP